MSGTSTGPKPVRNPLTWSLLAVAISVVALVIAVVAFARGGSTTTIQAGPASSRPGTATATAATTDQPTSEDSTETDTSATDVETPTDDSSDPVSTALPSPGASYTVSQQDVHVRIPGGNSRALDLDEPIVNSDSNQTDVYYYPSYDPPRLDFSSANVAEVKSAAVTPDECAGAIQLAPTDRSVPVSQDLVLCAVTNGIGAINEPSQAKMARIIVNSVSKDKSIDLTITTWVIPH